MLYQCAGGVGSVAACAGMIVSLAAGLAGSVGAAGGALAQGGGMAGMGSMGTSGQAQTGAPSLLTFLNHIAVPLLLVSIFLMLVGVARAGPRACVLVALGSTLLLASMVPASREAQAWLLAGGFALVIAGYVAAWRGAKRGREATREAETLVGL